ncbi:hypothetical protein [Spiroplasma cantharicola]|uniref:Uncharacterized protein n=1 Tax=Spiroplasma cantharicola TaxID=362837 RepID=A0A0M4JJN9_9MOLU|nr:hypothetical protein [Spiroplasma cantharicola]ALD66436.1 hypothetical protein SCANT_v1c05300 [Spiroplasma cantharicola]
MENIIDKNYFLDKVSKDKEIVDLLHKQTSKENIEFFEHLKELRRILHLKTQTDKKILFEYEKLIVIPTGSEDTLVKELNKFNKEIYANLPEHYILEFEKDENIKNTSSNNLEKAYQKNLNPIVEKTIQDFGDSISSESNPNDFIDNLLKDETYESEIIKNSREIYVDSNEEKNKMLLDIRDSLKKGNYNKLNLTKPFSLSTTKYMKKLEALKKGFEDTYGSELFKKVSLWVHKENQLYENIDRNKKINNLKAEKIKLKKKKRI